MSQLQEVAKPVREFREAGEDLAARIGETGEEAAKPAGGFGEGHGAGDSEARGNCEPAQTSVPTTGDPGEKQYHQQKRQKQEKIKLKQDAAQARKKEAQSKQATELHKQETAQLKQEVAQLKKEAAQARIGFDEQDIDLLQQKTDRIERRIARVRQVTAQSMQLVEQHEIALNLGFFSLTRTSCKRPKCGSVGTCNYSQSLENFKSPSTAYEALPFDSFIQLIKLRFLLQQVVSSFRRSISKRSIDLKAHYPA
ncbi:hypothetical protein MMC30_008264 [Trapelia coarctata]|nr:hypothetical protein [Trapelia coarctata]